MQQFQIFSREAEKLQEYANELENIVRNKKQT